MRNQQAIRSAKGRGNKNAIGFSMTRTRHTGQNGNSSKYLTHHEGLKMSIYGTLDSLTKNCGVLGFKKLINRPHPDFPEYTKKVYVLSPHGKRRLESARRARELMKNA